ncbi:MAG: glycoside hydrolase family 99-like domain-containing protein [Ignavibacteriales bacterium]|nr:glycoside hydrolase family 99-like domain-containing protein [Ignavibacteriales bacterium]
MKNLPNKVIEINEKRKTNMIKEINPFEHPICLEVPHRLVRPDAWVRHIPFAMYLVDILKPRMIVELGTHTGNSYCAFCQAVDNLSLETACFAVDTWQGDPQAGLYGPEVIEELRSYHDPKYGSFSTLMQTTFDEAVREFKDSTIDLLHIDGLHTYDAVKHDFETWLPKLSERSVVLFHDIMVSQDDFGVWKIWGELREKYPGFDFTHGHGLGILGVGKNQANLVQGIFRIDEKEQATFKKLFSFLGKRFEQELKLTQVEEILSKKDLYILDLKNHNQQLESENAQSEDLLAKCHNQLTQIKASKAWKLALFLRRVRKVVLPPNSLRARAFSKILAPVLKTLRERKIHHNLDLIRSSEFFDGDWYLHNNPDVRMKKFDPAVHFLLYGGFEGRDPGPNFNSQKYLDDYPDVIERNQNPLIHYIKFGCLEKRTIYKSYHFEYLDKKKKILEDLNEIEITQSFYERDVYYEDLEKTKTKLITFYLPQFHQIPENDKFWGKGFTEWTNLKQAKSFFEGHDQPKVPSDLGYYDLRDPEIMKRQAQLAKSHGLYGFCFYRYWFNGKEVLEKPLYQFLQNQAIDINFCICWANENWTRKWDGKENDILIKQEHNLEDDGRFLKNSIKFFKDPRYIKISNKPLLLIYNPKKLFDTQESILLWDQICKEDGFNGIYTIAIESLYPIKSKKYIPGFDAVTQFPPLQASLTNISNLVNFHAKFKGSVWDYREMIANFCLKPNKDIPTYRAVTPSWDNTARRGDHASIFINSHPKYYQYWLEKAIIFTKETHPEDSQFIFINAWNEWAEGAYLEPDQTSGYAYLNATSKAILNTEKTTNKTYRNGAIDVIFGKLGESDLEVIKIIRTLSKRTNIQIKFYSHSENKQLLVSELIHNVNYYASLGENNGVKIKEEILPSSSQGILLAGELSPEFIDAIAGSNRPVIRISDNINNSTQFKINYIPQEDLTEHYGVLSLLKKIWELTDIKPAVSIIIPSYNHALFLTKRLDTVLNQTLIDYEVIVADDCSSDKTVKILKKYAEIPNFSYWTNEQNSGSPFRQWVKGINKSRAEIIWIAEDDDFCEPDFLECLLPAFESPEILLAYCKSLRVDDKSEIKGDYSDYLNDLSTTKWNDDYFNKAHDEITSGFAVKNIIPNVSSVLFRKFDVAAIEKELCSYQFAGDWFFYLNAIQWGSVYYCSKPLNYHRRHKNTRMHEALAKLTYFKEIERIHKYCIENFVLDEKTIDGMKNRVLNEFRHLFGYNQIEKLEKNYSLKYLEEKKLEQTFNYPLNILIAIDGFYFGGAELFPIRLANHMSEIGHHITILNTNGLPSEERVRGMVSDQIRIVDVTDYHEQSMFLKEVVSEHQIDLINSHGWNADYYINNNIDDLITPWVSSMHGHHESLLRKEMGPYDVFLEEMPRMVERVDTFIYIHPKNLEVFEKFPQKSKRQLQQIPFLGISPHLPKQKNILGLGIPPDTFILGMVARGIKEKGWEEAIESINIINKKSSRNTHLIIIGGGAYLEELQSSNQDEKVHFIGYSDEVRSWMQTFHVGLLPTYYTSETHPLSIMEYLSCGIPVISTKIGMIPEMLDAKGSIAGYLLELNNQGKTDPKDISEFVLSYINNFDLYESHRKHANTAFEKLTINSCVKNYINLYRQILNGNCKYGE